MFNDADKLSLRIFCQEITRAPRGVHKHICSNDVVCLWCDDWEIIEVLKYLFIGPEAYDAEPLPGRLVNCPAYNRAAIIKKATEYLSWPVEEVISALRKRRALDGRA
uniref:Uncharacterized protein n=1 Tax=viral metagenome TaxID=1070528 RepID=A0A6M3ISW9_9ZZZZ